MLSKTVILLVAALSATVQAANFDVDVGPGLSYSPDHIATAASGDTVTFHFSGGSHTVTESTLEDPCSPAASGFDSGP
jgi:plastocyanin